jgi:hypothetical protein
MSAPTNRPVQFDLLTGKPVLTRPKAGNGDHIRLHNPGPKPIPVMAHWAGTGPEHKYCKDCGFFRDRLPIWRNGRLSPAEGSLEKEPKRYQRGACIKAAELYDGVVQPGGIALNSACRYFVESDDLDEVSF